MNHIRTLLTILCFFPLASALGAGAQASDILSQEKLYSQWNEELVIRDFFQDRRDGFFLDVGCAHPRKLSTTFYLEKHLGWKGIGVDAAERYGPGWEKFRPNSKFANYLVTDHSGTMDTFYITGHLPTSSSKKEMVKGMPHHEVKVPSTTLNELLEKEGVEKIDFLSLDIEGAMYEALMGFDIEKYAPELACVEKDHAEHKEDIPAYFEAHGYELLENYSKNDWVNWYFAPKDRAKKKDEGDSSD